MKIHEVKSTAAQCKNTDPSRLCDQYNNQFVCKSEKVVLEAKNIYKLFCITANVCKMRAV